MEILKNEIDKINYLKGLIRVSKADGVVEESEKMYFQLAATGLNLSEQIKENLQSYWEKEDGKALEFTDKRIALFFLQEAIQICYVDNKYDHLEKNEIKKIAEELNIDTDSLVSIENWVEEGYKWKAKGADLLEKLAQL